MLRAVVVDDEPDLRLLTRLTLEEDGNAQVVGEAADGVGGLAMIEELDPDVAVIDLHMPALNGVDLIALLRLRSVTTRIVAYSCDDLALRDAITAGADVAVLKTSRPEVLLLAIAS